MTLSATDFAKVERHIRTTITHPVSLPTRDRNLDICRRLLVDGERNKHVAADLGMTPQRVHSIMVVFKHRAARLGILVE